MTSKTPWGECCALPRYWRLVCLSFVVQFAGCASGPSRPSGAPIEDHGATSDSAVSAATPAVPDARQLPSVATPTVAAEVENTANADPGTLALLSPPRPPTAMRNPASSSLLAAAMQAAGEGEWERAEAALERALKLSPRDHELWRQLAYTHFRQGHYEQALTIAQRALSLSAGSPLGGVAAQGLIEDIQSARRND